MTDTLPRTIPTDPAEQERQMPEWVKVEVGRQNKLLERIFGPRSEYWPHALTIWKWVPEPVDPDSQMAREALASTCIIDSVAKEYLRGCHDNGHAMRACLAMAKRVREAKP